MVPWFPGSMSPWMRCSLLHFFIALRSQVQVFHWSMVPSLMELLFHCCMFPWFYSSVVHIVSLLRDSMILRFYGSFVSSLNTAVPEQVRQFVFTCSPGAFPCFLFFLDLPSFFFLSLSFLTEAVY
jgi:hypothetical protein